MFPIDQEDIKMRSSVKLFEDWMKLAEKLADSGVGQEMLQVIKMLLAVARSRKDLRRLHDETLEPDLRLCREDVIAVEDFWHAHFQPENPQGAEPISGTQAFFLLNHNVRVGTLSMYYAKRIEVVSGKVYGTLMDLMYRDGWEIVYSDPDRSGHGEYHYQVTMFDKGFSLACLAGPESKLRVLIELWGNALTEKFTHDVVTKLPKFDVARTGGSSEKGTHIALVYDIDGLGIVDHLVQGPPSHGKSGPPMQIGSQSFLQALVERLLEMGLPITHALTVE